jgi:hypothetical protein
MRDSVSLLIMSQYNRSRTSTGTRVDVIGPSNYYFYAMWLRPVHGITICLLLLALLTCRSSDGQTFTRRTEIPPVRLSYNDLTGVVERARELIKTSNASFSSSPYEHPHEYLLVDDRVAQVEITRDFSPASLAGAPEVAYIARYQYRFPDAPVSSVEFTLADYARDVVVEGQSRTGVDAISNLISSDLNRHNTSFAGPQFRSVGSLALLLFLFCAFAFAGLAPLSVPGRIALYGLGLCILVGLYSIPWSYWLAGTEVYAVDASWFQRHAPVLTFIGVLLPVFTSIVAGVRWMIKQIRPASQSADGSSAIRDNDRSVHLM